MVALPLQNRISQQSIKRHEYRTLELQFGDGYKQITTDGINDQFDEWDIQTTWLDTTDYDEYKTFLIDVKRNKKFSWTAFKDTVEKNWKITSQVTEIYSGNLTRISFTMRQTFDIG